jgi:hypothetical protein
LEIVPAILWAENNSYDLKLVTHTGKLSIVLLARFKAILVCIVL